MEILEMVMGPLVHYFFVFVYFSVAPPLLYNMNDERGEGLLKKLKVLNHEGRTFTVSHQMATNKQKKGIALFRERGRKVQVK